MPLDFSCLWFNHFHRVHIILAYFEMPKFCLLEMKELFSKCITVTLFLVYFFLPYSIFHSRLNSLKIFRLMFYVVQCRLDYAPSWLALFLWQNNHATMSIPEKTRGLCVLWGDHVSWRKLNKGIMPVFSSLSLAGIAEFVTCSLASLQGIPWCVSKASYLKQNSYRPTAYTACPIFLFGRWLLGKGKHSGSATSVCTWGIPGNWIPHKLWDSVRTLEKT